MGMTPVGNVAAGPTQARLDFCPYHLTSPSTWKWDIPSLRSRTAVATPRRCSHKNRRNSDTPHTAENLAQPQAPTRQGPAASTPAPPHELGPSMDATRSRHTPPAAAQARLAKIWLTLPSPAPMP